MCVFCLFFKQKTAYDMRISDWSSDVCSSDLLDHIGKIDSLILDKARGEEAIREKPPGPGVIGKRPAVEHNWSPALLFPCRRLFEAHGRAAGIGLESHDTAPCHPGFGQVLEQAQIIGTAKIG